MLRNDSIGPVQKDRKTAAVSLDSAAATLCDILQYCVHYELSSFFFTGRRHDADRYAVTLRL